MAETNMSSDDEPEDFCQFIGADFSDAVFEEEIIKNKDIYSDSLEVMLDNIIRNKKYLNDISYTKIDIIFEHKPILYSIEYDKEEDIKYVVFDDFVSRCLLYTSNKKKSKLLYILHKMIRSFELAIILNIKIHVRYLAINTDDLWYFDLKSHETYINAYADNLLQFLKLIYCLDNHCRYSYIYSTIKLIIENEIERKIPLSQIIFQKLMQF